MPIILRISLITFSIILIFITTYFLRQRRIPEKYSLIWFFVAVLIFLVGIIPSFLLEFAKVMGFEFLSNMIIATILVLLIMVVIILTIIVSDQKRKIVLIIQELSILKKKVEEKK